MFCTVSVKLAQDSEPLRNYLKQHDFQIYRYNIITGSLHNDEDNADQNNDVDYIYYQCVYNGFVPPGQEVFKRIFLEQLKILDLSIKIER